MFDDRNVSPWDVSQLERECFGGRASQDGVNSRTPSLSGPSNGTRQDPERANSAYMLFYDRKDGASIDRSQLQMSLPINHDIPLHTQYQMPVSDPTPQPSQSTQPAPLAPLAPLAQPVQQQQQQPRMISSSSGGGPALLHSPSQKRSASEADLTATAAAVADAPGPPPSPQNRRPSQSPPTTLLSSRTASPILPRAPSPHLGSISNPGSTTAAAQQCPQQTAYASDVPDATSCQGPSMVDPQASQNASVPAEATPPPETPMDDHPMHTPPSCQTEGAADACHGGEPVCVAASGSEPETGSPMNVSPSPFTQADAPLPAAIPAPFPSSTEAAASSEGDATQQQSNCAAAAAVAAALNASHAHPSPPLAASNHPSPSRMSRPGTISEGGTPPHAHPKLAHDPAQLPHQQLQQQLQQQVQQQQTMPMPEAAGPPVPTTPYGMSLSLYEGVLREDLALMHKVHVLHPDYCQFIKSLAESKWEDRAHFNKPRRRELCSPTRPSLPQQPSIPTCTVTQQPDEPPPQQQRRQSALGGPHPHSTESAGEGSGVPTVGVTTTGGDNVVARPVQMQGAGMEVDPHAGMSQHVAVEGAGDVGAEVYVTFSLAGLTRGGGAAAIVAASSSASAQRTGEVEEVMKVRGCRDQSGDGNNSWCCELGGMLVLDTLLLVLHSRPGDVDEHTAPI